MGASSDSRLSLVEQHLFGLHARAERARAEVEFRAGELADARRAAERAKAAMAIAQTSLAQLKWCEAQKRVEAAKAALDLATDGLAELESSRDELFGKLLG